VPGEPLESVLRKTGLGVFMAGGTTAAGFGALALAQHRGAESLGLVLFLGTTAALLCSLVVLPAVLVLIDQRARKR
jgi:predicted RND superfamily exporter protein